MKKDCYLAIYSWFSLQKLFRLNILCLLTDVMLVVFVSLPSQESGFTKKERLRLEVAPPPLSPGH